MTTISPDKTKSSRYQKSHAARNKKRLAGKLEWLSVSNVRAVCECCQHWLPDPNATMAMTALLTGWSISNLLKSNTRIICDSMGLAHIASPWSFSEPKVNSPLKRHLFRPMDTAPIPIPMELGKHLQDVLMHENKRGVTKESVSDFLKQISTEQDIQITTGRVSNVLHYYASETGLNALECRFISGQTMHDASQNYYVCFELGSIFEKLYKFWDWILDLTKWHYPMPPVQLFGSKRALCEPGFKAIFEWYEPQILEKILLNENREAFNLYTLYTIDLLQLATLSRPIDAIFGSLNNFDSSFEQVFIRDKGDSSSRILPIPKVIRVVLRHYVQLLNVIKEQTQLIDKNANSTFANILEGTAPLFHFWGKSQVTPVTNSEIKKRLSHFDIHRNWHRHTVITWLFEKGVCVNKIACFADHQPALENWFSQYSSLDIKSVTEISDHIEALVHRTAIPILLPPIY